MRLQLKVLLVLLVATISVAGLDYYNKHHDNKTSTPPKWSKEVVGEIVRKVCAASGQCDKIPPVSIVGMDIVNAYATKDQIVLFTGLLDKMKTEDEIALVVGHEMSHVLLGHTVEGNILMYRDIRVQELQADKYGAFLMMRAGYDICKGRNFMLMVLGLYGDVMDADHPDMAFRYNQLDVNCKGDL